MNRTSKSHVKRQFPRSARSDAEALRQQSTNEGWESEGGPVGKTFRAEPAKLSRDAPAHSEPAPHRFERKEPPVRSR